MVEPSSGAAAQALADSRLRIPVISEVPAGARRVRAPSTLLVHRDAFKTAAAGDGDDLDVATLAPPRDTPFAFSAIDVSDAASARSAERVLFRSLRKPQDGWTSRWLNRYVSLTLSRLLVKTPLSPNQVSVAILAVGLCGAWLASRGTYWDMLAGAFLFQAQSILDGCDGEMSRVTYRGSHLGEWLDTIGDDLTNYGFFAGLSLGLHTQSGSDPTLSNVYLLAGAVTVGCGVAASAIEYRYLIKIGSGDLLKYPTSQTHAGSGLMAAIAPLFKRDTFVLLTLVAAVLGLLGPMLVVFSIAAVGILLNVLAAEISMARARTAPRRP
jgi:CDP-L-myo-inositol myo-inositolphosphotransferase